MDGVIYYNVGYKCLVRLAVSISTLIRYYNGDVTILAGESGYDECAKIATSFGVNIKKISFDTTMPKNDTLLNKCRLHLHTPYDRTLFVDSDTIILKDFSECFRLLDEHEFIVTQFSNWRSWKYKNRIKDWLPCISDFYINHAYEEKKAINTGFYGWTKGAKIFDKWYDLAIKNYDSFIPDEICCQMLIPHVPHLVISSDYNKSCKHDSDISNAKILHFHGRKHCRMDGIGEYKYRSEMWYAEYDKISKLDFVKNNIQHDAQLRKNLYYHVDDLKRKDIP